tara:strand:+ start:501 stop:1373 length:873 start_codon:yes stop_codon:yes gene_type:complete
MSEPKQHYFQSQRLKINYWTWGDTTKPPMILVHGGRDHARMWDYVAELFTDIFYVLAYDLRGHGDSEWSRGSHYGIPENVLDLTKLIDLVGGRATVIGHSFGGAITLMTAGTFPDHFERVISIEGAGAWANQEPVTADEFRAWAMQSLKVDKGSSRVYTSLEEARDRMQQANPQFSPELALHLAQWGTNKIEGGYIWKFDPWIYARSSLHSLRFDEQQVLWNNVTAPVLHINGSDSHFNRAIVAGRPVETYFKNASAVTIDGAGHWAHHDQLNSTVATIRKFVEFPEGTS